MSRQQVSCDHIQIDVCVLNPPDGQPVRKLTKTDWEQLDLFADVSTREGGPPILTIGCTWDNLWVPLRLREPTRWWDRLSYVPKRFLSATTDVLPYAPTPVVSKCTQHESSKRLVSLPKRLLKKQDEEPHHIPSQKYSAGDGFWWDRLNSLPPRKITYQQNIFRKYQELLNKLTEEATQRNKQKLFRKDEYINRKGNKHFVDELQRNINVRNEYLMDEKFKKFHITDENKERSEVQLLDNSKELAVAELLEILRLEVEEAEGSLSFNFDKLSAIEEEASQETLLSDEHQVSDEAGITFADNINSKHYSTAESPVKRIGSSDTLQESQEVHQTIDSASRQSEHDVFEETISFESASEQDTLEILSNIDTEGADTRSDLADIDGVEIPKGEQEKESSGASKDQSAHEEYKGESLRKKRYKTVDLGTEPWWERLSKPPARILAALYVPLTKPIKTRRRKWVGTSDEYWVERLSKPRRPVVRRESFKPKRLEINKRSQRLLQRKRKEANGNDYWWQRLSKPRGIRTAPNI